MAISSEPIKVRVVIADDDVENGLIVEAAMKTDGHLTRVVADGESALHLVRTWSPHVVLLDINMPKMTGTEALKKIRLLSGGEYVGVLFITANAQLEEIVEGLDAGADDYVIKPYRLDELRARVRACLRTKSLHDALRRANKRLEDAANLDDLTGLFNMRYAAKRFADEVEAARRNHQPVSCIMFDMDHFKSVNDCHDHLFGSHVLREVAQVILPVLRSSDFAARYGGDEYFVAMPNTKLKDAVALAERMRKQIEAHLFTAGAFSARVTASFGVAGSESFTLPATADARELIRSADNSLYVAKNKGRNCTETHGAVKLKQ